VKIQLSILLGVVPFALIFGALAISASIPPIAVQGYSLLVFADSAQFLAIGLINSGATSVVVVLSIFIVNLRHAFYSATMAPMSRHLPLRWKAPLAWLLMDEAFVMTAARYARGNTQAAHWFMLGTGLSLYVTWQLGTFAGIIAGSLVPYNGVLDFALPLTFLALLVPTLNKWPVAAASLTAGVLAVLLNELPFQLGLLLAMLAGVTAGLLAERKNRVMEAALP